MRERHPALGVVGVCFLTVAALTAWHASGHTLGHGAVRFGVPALLIALGLLGITLGRRR